MKATITNAEGERIEMTDVNSISATILANNSMRLACVLFTCMGVALLVVGLLHPSFWKGALVELFGIVLLWRGWLHRQDLLGIRLIP